MITMQQALTANNFEHVTLKNADGTPQRCRRNGKTKTWKTRSGEFQIPVKAGLYAYGYLNQNTNDWIAV